MNRQRSKMASIGSVHGKNDLGLSGRVGRADAPVQIPQPLTPICHYMHPKQQKTKIWDFQKN